MKRLFRQGKECCAVLTALVMSFFDAVPALAVSPNVAAGDRSAAMLPVMVGLLIVSAVAVAGFLIAGARKARRK